MTCTRRPLHEPRPSCWWMRPRSKWESHWRQSEIPADDLEAYLRWERAQAQRTQENAPPRYVPGVQE